MTPSPHFVQNLGEAEYAVALFMYIAITGVFGEEDQYTHDVCWAESVDQGCAGTQVQRQSLVWDAEDSGDSGQISGRAE